MLLSSHAMCEVESVMLAKGAKQGAVAKRRHDVENHAMSCLYGSLLSHCVVGCSVGCMVVHS